MLECLNCFQLQRNPPPSKFEAFKEAAFTLQALLSASLELTLKSPPLLHDNMVTDIISIEVHIGF